MALHRRKQNVLPVSRRDERHPARGYSATRLRDSRNDRDFACVPRQSLQTGSMQTRKDSFPGYTLTHDEAQMRVLISFRHHEPAIDDEDESNPPRRNVLRVDRPRHIFQCVIKFSMRNFDGDVSTQFIIISQKHLPEPARPQQSFDSIPANPLGSVRSIPGSLTWNDPSVQWDTLPRRFGGVGLARRRDQLFDSAVALQFAGVRPPAVVDRWYKASSGFRVSPRSSQNSSHATIQILGVTFDQPRHYRFT